MPKQYRYGNWTSAKELNEVLNFLELPRTKGNREYVWEFIMNQATALIDMYIERPKNLDDIVFDSDFPDRFDGDKRGDENG